MKVAKKKEKNIYREREIKIEGQVEVREERDRVSLTNENERVELSQSPRMNENYTCHFGITRWEYNLTCKIPKFWYPTCWYYPPTCPLILRNRGVDTTILPPRFSSFQSFNLLLSFLCIFYYSRNLNFFFFF